ncbi:hypothetical protein VE03_09145 [Pseudogymnoascus sp. 23342-1-I1]|nr:hypothetical protein VE03_09145 [Pseudogymnoascus sp. 23342-1-I1]
MELFKNCLCDISKPGGLLDRYGVRMRVLGRLELLEPDLLLTIQRTTDLTRNYGDKIINVCIAYTSRDEIAGAIRQTVAGCKIPVEADKFRSDLVRDSSTRRSLHLSSDLSLCDGLDKNSTNIGQPMATSAKNITTETLTDHMLTAGDPPLDLLIRTLKSYIPMLYQVVTRKLSLYYGSSSAQPVVRIFAPHHGIYCLSPTQSGSEKSNFTAITLLLLSASDGRETLVDLTKSIAEMWQTEMLLLGDINIELIDAKLSEIISLPSQSVPTLNDTNHSSSHLSDLNRPSTPLWSVKPEPDFLLIDGPYVKLDGYPPWQIRLTEIYCTGKQSCSVTGHNNVVRYQTFLRGLYQYAGAEMRFGR